MRRFNSRNFLRYVTFDLIVIRFLQLLLLVNLFNVIFLQIFGLDDFLFHEVPYSLLYAQNNLQNLSIMSPSFTGRETAPFGMAVIYTILLIFGFDISLFTHQVGLIIFDFSILLLIYIFRRSKILSLKATLLIANLIFVYFTTSVTSYSWKDQVWIWPMNSYGVLDFFSLLLSLIIILILFKYTSNENGLRYLKFILYVLFFLLSLNGMRTLITVVFPSFVSFIFVYLIKFRTFKKDDSGLFKVVLSSFVSIMLGYGGHQFLWGTYPQLNQDSHLTLSLNSAEQFGINLSNIPTIWFNLFDSLPLVPTGVLSLNFLYLVAKIVFSIVLLLIPIMLLKRLNKTTSIIIIYAFAKLLILFIILFIPYIFSNNDYFPRYLIPLVYAIFLLLVLALELLGNKMLIVLLSTLFVISTFNLLNLHDMLKTDINQTFVSQINGLLSEKKVSKGYFSPYSNGFLNLNLISGGKIVSAPIDVDIENNYFTKHYHADSDWYNTEPRSNSFLFTSSWFDEKLNESQIMAVSELIENVRSKKISFQKISYPNGDLFIFDSDISEFIN